MPWVQAYTILFTTDPPLPGSLCPPLSGQGDYRKINKKSLDYLEANIEAVAKHASETERRAENIEREITKLKMIEYMTRHIGEEFTGRISGVTSFGFFVELKTPLKALCGQDLKDDFYTMIQICISIWLVNICKIYRLGLEIIIKVARADISAKQIDFVPMD